MGEQTRSSGSVRAYLFDSWAVFLSPRLNRAPHRHGVMQLSISLGGGPHRVAVGEEAPILSGVHLVAPNTVHALHCETPTLVAWIEPESELGRRLAHAHLTGSVHATPDSAPWGTVVGTELRRALEERWPPDAFRPVGENLYAQLVGHLGAPPTAVHPAVRKALRIIRAGPATKVVAADLAREVGLSESRFLHAFSASVGLPLRAYLRWRRVFGALALIAGDGTTATEAAAAMGFSDSAHLTRVMRDFLAISPSGYARRKEHVLEIADCTTP